MDPLALELVCNFMTKDEPNLWKEDLQELAALAKTCKQASEACGPTVKEYKGLEQFFFSWRYYDENLEKFNKYMEREYAEMYQRRKEAYFRSRRRDP